MGSHIEWITPKCIPFWRIGILRMGRAFKLYGDPFEFACTVIRLFKEIELKGAASECSADLVRERGNIRDLLSPMKINKVKWTRRKNGRIKEIEIKL
jgi:hypothetical protein